MVSAPTFQLLRQSLSYNFRLSYVEALGRRSRTSIIAATSTLVLICFVAPLLALSKPVNWASIGVGVAALLVSRALRTASSATTVSPWVSIILSTLFQELARLWGLYIVQLCFATLSFEDSWWFAFGMAFAAECYGVGEIDTNLRLYEPAPDAPVIYDEPASPLGQSTPRYSDDDVEADGAEVISESMSSTLDWQLGILLAARKRQELESVFGTPFTVRTSYAVATKPFWTAALLCFVADTSFHPLSISH